MLTITETKDKKTVQNFLDELGCQYQLGDDIVMACADRGELLGVASLCLKSGRVYLELLKFRAEADEISLRLGLAKSIMNLADLRGIKEIHGSNPKLEELYKMLRFKEENNEYKLSLEGYFTAEHK